VKISINQLRRYIVLPESSNQIQDLMEDIGLEVKKVEHVEDDTIFTLELLANRGDHHCYSGIAREIYGRTNWAVSNIELKELVVNQDCAGISVSTEKCLNYTLTEFTRTGAADNLSLDPTFRQMLTVSGVNSTIPLIDITNIVNIELGQPMHVFDADKIVGSISVRETTGRESARLLFSDMSIILDAGTLVIADDIKILAVAGIAGCEESKPTEQTIRIYLESATFDPVSIRTTAKRLKLQTLSSMRFERGADPSLAITATKRANLLLNQVGWVSEKGIKVVKYQDFEKTIQLNLCDINNYFDTAFDKKDLIALLARYGFTFHNNSATTDRTITVPPHRIWDINITEDLYEEIARAVGYNQLPSTPLTSTAGILPSQLLTRKDMVNNLLIGEGFFEVFTDGFYSEKHRSALAIPEDHPLQEHVRTVNASDKSYALLKNNALTQAVELVLTNINAKNPNIKAFEWTRIFKPSIEDHNGLCHEYQLLWAIVSGFSRPRMWDEAGKQVDFFYMKGIIERLADCLSISLHVKPIIYESHHAPISICLHPFRKAGIYYDEELVGILGEVHPKVILAWGIKNFRPYYLEISQKILTLPLTDNTYIAPPRIQPIVRDVCLLLSRDLPAKDVADFIKRQSLLLGSVEIADVYSPDKNNGRNAVTFSLIYDQSKSLPIILSSTEINDETNRVIHLTLGHYSAFSVEQR
jgi:phenylalanyl-tRNA synthetase beta chain